MTSKRPHDVTPSVDRRPTKTPKNQVLSKGSSSVANSVAGFCISDADGSLGRSPMKADHKVEKIKQGIAKKDRFIEEAKESLTHLQTTREKSKEILKDLKEKLDQYSEDDEPLTYDLPPDFKPCVEPISKMAYEKLVNYLEKKPDNENVTLNAEVMGEWNRIERLKRENEATFSRLKVHLQKSMDESQERLTFYRQFLP